MVRKENPSEILVFGDSEMMIKALVSEKELKDPMLNKQLTRLKKILRGFLSAQFFHILRGLNKEADRLANIGCTPQSGMISINADLPIKATIP
jgi:hypothetical protein